MSFDIPKTMNAVEFLSLAALKCLSRLPGRFQSPAMANCWSNAAVGVNFPDTMQRQGGYPPPPGITDIQDWNLPARWLQLVPTIRVIQ